MDEILVKYLLEEASVEERKTVLQWLQQSPKNQDHFRQMQEVWQSAKQLETTSRVDVNQAWANWQKRFAFEEQPGLPIKNKTSRLPFVRIAAAAILLLSVGIYFYTTTRPVLVLAQESVRTDTLPDQSVVTLNKHAAIRYHKSFNKKDRKISLEGEAFFEVTANKKIPFELEVNGVQVKVVGTSFNVKSEDDFTEVIVETGIVQVMANGQSVAIHPGQRIRVRKGSEELQVQKNTGLLYNYYRSQELICNNTPLQQLVDALNEAYTANIIIANPAIAQKRITTRFQLGSLEGILAIVSTTLNVQVIHKDGKIILQ